nr:immunoglobulin heavy chain junction region [Mus musculus]
CAREGSGTGSYW